jgi:hypothetical protein
MTLCPIQDAAADDDNDDDDDSAQRCRSCCCVAAAPGRCRRRRRRRTAAMATDSENAWLPRRPAPGGSRAATRLDSDVASESPSHCAGRKRVEASHLAAYTVTSPSHRGRAHDASCLRIRVRRSALLLRNRQAREPSSRATEEYFGRAAMRLSRAWSRTPIVHPRRATISRAALAGTGSESFSPLAARRIRAEDRPICDRRLVATVTVGHGVPVSMDWPPCLPADCRPVALHGPLAALRQKNGGKTPGRRAASQGPKAAVRD